MTKISKTVAIKFVCDNLPQYNEDWVNALEDAGLYDFEEEELAYENGEEYKLFTIYDIFIALGISKQEYSEAFPNTNFNWPEEE